MRIPVSTYRLQLGPQLRFADVKALLPYLEALGITDLYLSPILKARQGSTHGYDVVDPTQIDPALGSEEELASLAQEARRRDMGILLDVVPNHMCISDLANRWWRDVLENGPSSPYAGYFDIDWHPPKAELENKVLLPVLGDQYGKVLEAQELQVDYEGGAFHVRCYHWELPLAPRSAAIILERALGIVREELGRSNPHVHELESIITATGYLPLRTETAPEAVRERQREKEVIKRRIAALTEACGEVKGGIVRALKELNGRRGDPRSFDGLEALLAEQAYRLCHWQVAADEVNYRRFFDINELAAIRVEEPEVFQAVHEVVFRLVRKGWVTGLRIDHVDGLFDPAAYLNRVQEAAREALRDAGVHPEAGARGSGQALYVVVEKILGRRERLRSDWAAAGTTGYDFLNQLNGLFVDGASERSFRERYERFTGRTMAFGDVVNASKKLIMLVALASELRVLAWTLDEISEQHRYSRDFTRESLRFALREVIAAFPVYRSYVRANGRVDAADRKRVQSAIEEAKRRNPATAPSIFDFIGNLLLRQDPEGISAEARAERTRFVMRLQQLTSPVMAKGLEDTAFYRYFPLASLNEVGGDAGEFGSDAAHFHRIHSSRREAWPHSLLATSTHDTKRGEDVRARLNVLSEIPGEFWDAVRRWRRLTAPHRRSLGSAEAPDRNDEYLIYQTLAGAWPVEGGSPRFRERLREYMIKAVREAKVHTSWIKPDAAYEEALLSFIDGILDESAPNAFLDDFRQFHQRIAQLGALNCLSQVLLKATAPGVPDFYQGTELYSLTLVDPDNRHPVDFETRRRFLDEIDRRVKREGKAKLAQALLRDWKSGQIKLFVTAEALRFRRKQRSLFQEGGYAPVSVEGEHAERVFAFERRTDSGSALVAVPRLLAALAPGPDLCISEEIWRGTRLILTGGAPARWRNVLTDEWLTSEASGTKDQPARTLDCATLFSTLPVALLEAAVGAEPDQPMDGAGDGLSAAVSGR